MNTFFRLAIMFLAVLALTLNCTLNPVYADAQTVTMCPNTTSTVTTTSFTPPAGFNSVEVKMIGGDTSVATTTHSGQNIVVTSGANDTEKVKKTNIYFIHRVRNAISGLVSQIALKLEIRVLPKKQCQNGQGQPANQAQVTLQDMGFLSAEVCVGKTATINGNKIAADTTKTIAGGFEVRSTNPDIATVTHQMVPDGTDGAQRLQITVTGVKEGIARIKVKAIGVADMKTTFSASAGEHLVYVKECPEEKKEENKDHGYLPGYGTKELGEYALATRIFTTPYGDVVVHLPGDAAAGDAVSGTVMLQPSGNTPEEKMQNGAQLTQYKVQVESVSIISDGPPKQFSLQIPDNATSTGISLQSPEGKQLIQTGVNLAKKVLTKIPGFELPKSHTAGQPIAVPGDFDGKFNNTALTMGGKEAIKLAESPRTLIAIPDNKSAAGDSEIVLKEGAQVERGKFTLFLADNGGAKITGPAHMQQAQPTEALSPVQQAIKQMCDATVDLYRQNLHAMVDEGWQAPKPPSKGTWTALLEYDITRTSGVTNVRVTQGSGFSPIDESAKARVYQMQGQFRSFPSCYTLDVMPVTHTFKVIYR